MQSWGEGQMGQGYGAMPTVPMVAGTKNHQAKVSGLCPEGDGASELSQRSHPMAVWWAQGRRHLSSFNCRL